MTGTDCFIRKGDMWVRPPTRKGGHYLTNTEYDMWRYRKQWGQSSHHTKIAEAILGRTLAKGQCIHHIDNDGRNNNHSNLVICPSEEYHKLLHFRQIALEEFGDANAKQCKYCHNHDHESNLKSYARKDSHTRRYYHPVCHRDHVSNLRLTKRNQQ